MKNYKLLIVMIIVIILIIILLTLGIIFINLSPKNQYTQQPKQEEIQKEVSRVQNHNDFFTVVNCVDKYVTYLSTQNKDILYLLLDEEYKQEKGINQSNIDSHIKTLNDYYKFKAKEMYVRKIKDTISQYYVYGVLTLETTEDDEEETPFYISIKLDKGTNTFSVIPDTYIEGLSIKNRFIDNLQK